MTDSLDHKALLLLITDLEKNYDFFVAIYRKVIFVLKNVIRKQWNGKKMEGLITFLRKTLQKWMMKGLRLSQLKI